MTLLQANGPEFILKQCSIPAQQVAPQSLPVSSHFALMGAVLFCCTT